MKAWLECGANMSSFQAAAQKVLQGKGLQGMKTYLQRQPTPQSNQCREMQPCTSSPTEVLDRSWKETLVFKHLQTSRYFICVSASTVQKTDLLFFIYIFVQAEEIERVVSEEEMEAAALTWSQELHDCPLPQHRQHPM